MAASSSPLLAKCLKSAPCETPARRQIEIALNEGLFFLGSGLTDPDVSMAASLILFSAYGLDRPAALNAPQFLGDSLLAQPIAVHSARAELPSGPGLGVAVDEAKVAALIEKPWTE